MKTVKIPDNINQLRLEAVIIGHISQQGIAAIVPCGIKQAKNIQDAINAEIVAEGRQPLFNGRVSTKRVLDYIGITPSEIEANVAKEQALRNSTPTGSPVYDSCFSYLTIKV